MADFKCPDCGGLVVEEPDENGLTLCCCTECEYVYKMPEVNTNDQG